MRKLRKPNLAPRFCVVTTVGICLVIGVMPLSQRSIARAQAPTPQPQDPDTADAAAAEAAPPKQQFGPPYRELPIEPDLVRQRLAISRILRGGQIAADQEQAFRTYYQRYAMARWTRLDHLDKLPQCRKDLRNELIMSGKSSQGANSAHDQLIAMSLTFMRNVARMNFHPASRFNAMLALGDLNQREAAGLNKPPVPLPQTLPIMLDTLDDPNQLNAVKLAALIGIRRHCTIGVADQQLLANRIVPTLTKIVTTKDSQPRLSPEGHAWLRAIAAETLAGMKSVGDQGVVANSLRDVVVEEDAPLFLRYVAAKSMGQLDYQGIAGLDASTFIYNLGLLAVHVCDTQQQILDEQERVAELKGLRGRPSGTGGGMGDMGIMDDVFGGMGGGARPVTAGTDADREDRRVNCARRRLKEGLGSVLRGLGKESTRSRGDPHGIDVLATLPQHRDLISKISQPIHDCFATIDKKDGDFQIEAETLYEAIDLVRESLAQAVGTLGPVPDPPGTEPEDAEQPTPPEEPDTPLAGG